MMIHKIPVSTVISRQLEFQIDSDDQTLQHHLKSTPRNATHAVAEWMKSNRLALSISKYNFVLFILRDLNHTSH